MISVFYGAAATATFLLALLLRPWGMLLLWPAFSFAAVSAAYAGVGPALFDKREGRLPLKTRVLLAPYLLGAWLSFRRYALRDEPYSTVAPGLIVGRRLNQREAIELSRRGVTAVLDLTAEFSECGCLRGMAYLNITVLDLTCPMPEQLARAVSFIREHRRHGGCVYLHCALGYSRSACVAAAYLLAIGRALTPGEAVDIIKAARPKAVVNLKTRWLLAQFGENLRQTKGACLRATGGQTCE